MDSVEDVLWSPIENKTSSTVYFYYTVLVLAFESERNSQVRQLSSFWQAVSLLVLVCLPDKANSWLMKYPAGHEIQQNQ